MPATWIKGRISDLGKGMDDQTYAVCLKEEQPSVSRCEFMCFRAEGWF